MSHELTDWDIEAGATATAGRVPASTPILAVDRLCKRYGGTVAVDGISFSVGHNEIVGLVGPNGAGKTTTINMVIGVLDPTSGNIRFGRADIATRRSQALQHTIFAAVYAPLPGNLTVNQNLRIFGLIYGMHDLRARIDNQLRQFDLMRLRDSKCGVLSSGEQTCVGFAMAFFYISRLLLLDYPTASFVSSALHDIRARIMESAARG